MLVWTLDSCRLTQPNFYEPTVLSALFFQRILFPDASQRKASPVGQVFVRNSRAQDMFYSWTTTAAPGIQDTWDERGKACVSHHFLCVCMCVSSDGCRLRSAWATDFANKVKQTWTTPLKALHCIFHQRAICRQTEGENDLGTDVFTLLRRANYESQISANQILFDSLCSI